MDDVELWDLASHAHPPHRGHVVERLAADVAQRERVEALLAQPAPTRDDGQGPRYEVLGLIGAGTQADVYQARRLDLDRSCALKVFRSVSDPAFIERVRAEAGLMARVLSPHVVTVFDAGDLGDGRFFIEMALCAEPDVLGPTGAVALGRSLRAHVLERGPLSPEEAARLLQPICAAVAAAHRAGVVHSDVKPENVLVLPASRRAMLADFGIAASLAIPRAQGTASRIGTLSCMAPEQFDSRVPPDVSSDVYGLGGTLLFALTGSPPHPERRETGEDPLQGAPHPIPSTVPRSLAEVVERALARDPALRPRADELAEALDAFLAHRPTTWDLERPARRLSLFYQRHRLLLNLAFAGAVLAMTLGMGLLWTVVAKSGLEARAGDLSRHLALLESDVARLTEQRSTLEAELARLRSEREAIAGSQAREREARLQAEGRSSEADAQLTAAGAAAREAAGKLARAEASVAQLASRLADSDGRVKSLEAEVRNRDAERTASAERYRASVDALRQGWEGDSARLRQDVARERESGAALQRRLAEAEHASSAAAQAKIEAEARLGAGVEACRADRDDLRRQLEAVRPEPARAEGAGKPASGAKLLQSP
jgi:serine/threonine protein kinase